MIRLVRLGVRLGVVLVLLASLGASALYYSIVTTPYENLMRQWIAHIDEATALLAGVDDQASARDAAVKLNAANDAFVGLMKRTREQTGEITPEEDARLWAKYGYQFNEAGRRFRNHRTPFGDIGPNSGQSWSKPPTAFRG